MSLGGRLPRRTDNDRLIDVGDDGVRASPRSSAELPTSGLDEFDDTFMLDALRLRFHAKAHAVTDRDGVPFFDQTRAEHAPNRAYADALAIIDVGV
jgi:hypothetical protein